MSTKTKCSGPHANSSIKEGRRDFLKSAGVIAGAGLLAQTQSFAGQSEATAASDGSLRSATSTDYDVVIIGAGNAGVTAAREASHSGLKTLVLEARNRVGGRVFTSTFAGRKADLGGTWTYWGHPYMWSELTRYGLSLESNEGTYEAEELLWLADGKLTRGDGAEFDALYQAVFEEYCQDARNAYPRPFEASVISDKYKHLDKMSLQDRVDEMQGLTQVQLDLLSSQLSSACSSDLKNAGFVDMLRWWAQHHSSYLSFFDMASYHIKEGAAALPEAIAADSNATIELGTAVASVKQEESKATVTTESGDSVTARAVIVAVPVNVLSDIDFSPELNPAKMEMSRERHAASGFTVYMELEGQYKKLNAMAPDSAPFTWIYTAHQSRDHSTFKAFGPSHERVDVNDDAAIEEALKQWFPKPKVLQSYSYDWNIDPYSKGNWSWYKPMQSSKYLPALQQREGRLFFAGADIADGMRGWMDGAIESGLKIGRQVARELT